MDIRGGSWEKKGKDMSKPQTLLLLTWGGLEWQEIRGGTKNIYEEDGVSDVESEDGDLDSGGGIKYVLS
jgi:hypothetical protein